MSPLGSGSGVADAGWLRLAQGEFNVLAGDMARQYPDRARLWFAYDEPLSHLIYAGSDIFLVPSMFEPCGLTQMIAMRCAAAIGPAGHCWPDHMAAAQSGQLATNPPGMQCSEM